MQRLPARPRRRSRRSRPARAPRPSRRGARRSRATGCRAPASPRGTRATPRGSGCASRRCRSGAPGQAARATSRAVAHLRRRRELDRRAIMSFSRIMSVTSDERRMGRVRDHERVRPSPPSRPRRRRASSSCRSAIPQPAPCVVSARPLGVRAVKSIFSPSASRPSGGEHGARRSRAAARARPGCVGSSADRRRRRGCGRRAPASRPSGIPRLPPEEDALAARVAARRSSRARSGHFVRVRLVRAVGGLPLVVEHDRARARRRALELRRGTRRSSPASRSSAAERAGVRDARWHCAPQPQKIGSLPPGRRLARCRRAARRRARRGRRGAAGARRTESATPGVSTSAGASNSPSTRVCPS